MNKAIPSPELLSHIGQILGSPPVRWTRVAGRTVAERWVVYCRDGSSAFVKAATDPDTARWLRDEYAVYSQLTGEFLPSFLGWGDGDRPILILEDLSSAHWPPPWSAERVDRVLAALAAVRASSPPHGLASLELERDNLTSWRRVASDPRPFLSLGLCTADWLESSLPDLLAAEAQAVLDGQELLHLDVRSDNLCFTSSRAILVDWNWACRGNGLLDIAAWLPSLHAEGGPPPEAILPDQPELAALLSGVWAERAGKPPPQPGAGLREIQLKQLRTALPWAARALGLSPPLSIER